MLAAALVVLAVVDRRRSMTAPATQLAARTPATVGGPLAVDGRAAGSPATSSGPSPALRLVGIVLAVVTGLSAVASVVQVTRIGHAGAKATYQGTPTDPRPDAPES